MDGEDKGLDGPAWQIDQSTPRARRAAARSGETSAESHVDNSGMALPASPFTQFRDRMDIDSDSGVETVPGRGSPSLDGSARATAAPASDALASRSGLPVGYPTGQLPVATLVDHYEQDLRNGVDSTIVNHAFSRKAAIEQGTDATIIERSMSHVSGLQAGTDTIITEQAVSHVPGLRAGTEAIITEEAASHVAGLRAGTEAIITEHASNRIPRLQRGTDEVIDGQVTTRDGDIRKVVDRTIDDQAALKRPEIEGMVKRIVLEHARTILGSQELEDLFAQHVAERQEGGQTRSPDHAPPPPGDNAEATTPRMEVSPATRSAVASLPLHQDPDQPLPSIEPQETIMPGSQDHAVPSGTTPMTVEERLADLTAKFGALLAKTDRLEQENAVLRQSRAPEERRGPEHQSYGGLGNDQPPPGFQPRGASPYVSVPRDRLSFAPPPMAYQPPVQSSEPARYAPPLTQASLPTPDQASRAPSYPPSFAPTSEAPSFQTPVPAAQPRRDIAPPPVLDITGAPLPDVSISASYPVELAIRSENTMERARAVAMGAREVSPTLSDGARTIGELRWFVPEGVELNNFPGLPQGVRHDIAIAADARPGQPIVIEDHGWRQGVENGRTFTYKSGEAVLNVKDREHHTRTKPACAVMRSGGPRNDGSLEQRAYRVKGGQDITPVAHLVSPNEKRTLDEAGLGDVHQQATWQVAEQARNLPGRAQSNARLVNYGYSLHPQYSPAMQSYAAGAYGQHNARQFTPGYAEQARSQEMLPPYSSAPPTQVRYGSQMPGADGTPYSTPGYGGHHDAPPLVRYAEHVAPPTSYQPAPHLLDPRVHSYVRGH